MIVIDGRQSEMCLANYATLEEVLATLVKEELSERIVTDVLVNKEAFSELYPHQAEDIDAKDIEHLELKTVSLDQMAADVILELPKVVELVAGGCRQVADLFRKAEIAEGIDVLQDVLYVSRDFLETINTLRNTYSSGQDSPVLEKLSGDLGALLDEIVEVLANEDWMLMADLLEFEYLPACEGWKDVIAELSEAVVKAAE